MTCAIDVDRVSFAYDDFRMEDINLELHIGEQKAIAGLNGSGKTTLFKLILGLLEPRSGQIFVRDRRVTRENLWEVRQDVGFLFQNPEDQLFAPTVWEDVAFGPRNLGLEPQAVSDRVDWALERVGMSSFSHRSVTELSHGQAKRIALAGVIAMRPSILILDEPFTGLDFKMVQNMVDIIRDLKQDGVSILFTTHDSFFIENWSDTVAVLEEGKIVFDGPTKDAMRDDRVTRNVGDWGQLRHRLRNPDGRRL